MALFKISKGNSSGLKDKKAINGFCWFTPDDGKFYIDIAGTADEPLTAKIGENRICLNAAMADQLSTARAIGNASFNGTADISFKKIGFIDSLYSNGASTTDKTQGYPAIYFASDNNRDTYLRAPQPNKALLDANSGFLPVQQGTIGNGTSSLGLPDFYFAKSYVDNSYVKQINFDNGAASLQYDSTNKCINFVFA